MMTKKIGIDKDKRNKRIQQKQRHIEKQVELYKQFFKPEWEVQPHKFHKRKSLNCGDPDCVMCANPRKFFKELTMQEKKFYCEPVDLPE